MERSDSSHPVPPTSVYSVRGTTPRGLVCSWRRRPRCHLARPGPGHRWTCAVVWRS